MKRLASAVLAVAVVAAPALSLSRNCGQARGVPSLLQRKGARILLQEVESLVFGRNIGTYLLTIHKLKTHSSGRGFAPHHETVLG